MSQFPKPENTKKLTVQLFTHFPTIYYRCDLPKLLCHIVLWRKERYYKIVRYISIGIGIVGPSSRYRYRGKIVYRFHGYHIKKLYTEDYIATVTEAYKKYTIYFVILVTVNNIVALRYGKGTKSVRY
jgi:hypothetical protein